MRCIQAGLDEVLAFWLRDKRLELRGRESIDEACLGHDEKEYLRSGQGRELVRLIDASGRREGLRTSKEGWVSG